jgi:hypothetical protein
LYKTLGSAAATLRLCKRKDALVTAAALLGSLSAGSTAQRVVERYYGPQAARGAAYNMEYRRTPRPLSISDV